MTPTEHAEFVAAIRANAAHNTRERNRSVTYGPLICTCATPVVTGQGYGQCQTCFRPPLSGFRILRGAA